MPFDILRFVLGKVIAANQGVSDERATQLGLIGSVMPGSPVMSTLIPLVIAQREAETIAVVPSVTAQPASNLTETTATLNGTVNARNANTTVTFEIRTQGGSFQSKAA